MQDRRAAYCAGTMIFSGLDRRQIGVALADDRADPLAGETAY
jgi:hypothetical protein